MSKPAKFCPNCSCRMCRRYQAEVRAKNALSLARKKRREAEERKAWESRRASGIPIGKKVDPRRNSMMWLLRFATRTSFNQIGKHFSRTGQTTTTVFLRGNRIIEAAARREIGRPTLAATKRLIEVGALRDATGLRHDLAAFDLAEFDRLFSGRAS